MPILRASPPVAVVDPFRSVFHRRSKVTASTVSLSDKQCNACKRDHTGHHVGGHTRSAPTGGEQILKHLIGEQLPPMRRQEPDHAARLEQMPRHRLRIKDLPLSIRSTLQPHNYPKNL